jgi:hypothetical protein
MNCPHCQENMDYYQLGDKGYYNCNRNNHYFYYQSNVHFFLKVHDKITIKIGIDPAGSYIFVNSKIIIIKPFKLEDCNTIIDKYLKLKAFL